MKAAIKLLLITSISSSAFADEKVVNQVTITWAGKQCIVKAVNLSEEEANDYSKVIQEIPYPSLDNPEQKFGMYRSGKCPFTISKDKKFVTVDIGSTEYSYKMFFFDNTQTPIKFFGASSSPSKR